MCNTSSMRNHIILLFISLRDQRIGFPSCLLLEKRIFLVYILLANFPNAFSEFFSFLCVRSEYFSVSTVTKTYVFPYPGPSHHDFILASLEKCANPNNSRDWVIRLHYTSALVRICGIILPTVPPVTSFFLGFAWDSLS